MSPPLLPPHPGPWASGKAAAGAADAWTCCSPSGRRRGRDPMALLPPIPATTKDPADAAGPAPRLRVPPSSLPALPARLMVGHSPGAHRNVPWPLPPPLPVTNSHQWLNINGHAPPHSTVGGPVREGSAPPSIPHGPPPCTVPPQELHPPLYGDPGASSAPSPPQNSPHLLWPLQTCPSASKWGAVSSSPPSAPPGGSEPQCQPHPPPARFPGWGEPPQQGDPPRASPFTPMGPVPRLDRGPAAPSTERCVQFSLL